MPRANLSRLSLLVVLAALTGTASGPGKSTAWWTAVPEIVLFEEDFRNPELPGWRRTGGEFRLEAETGGDFGAMVAEEALQCDFEAPSLPEYVLQAKVRLSATESPVTLELASGEAAASCRLQVFGDSSNSEVGLRVREGDRTVASETQRFKPAVQSGWGPRSERELKQLSERLPGWRGRWMTLRVELTGESIWFYFEGRALAEVPRQGGRVGSIRFMLPQGAALSRVKVTQRSWARGGFLPLDLTGYRHNDAADPAQSAGRAPEAPWDLSEPGLPSSGSLVEVAGVPFLWTEAGSGGPGYVDVGPARWRGAEKEYGGFGLFQQPLGSVSAMDGDPATLLLRVPKRFYRKVHLLCASSASPSRTTGLGVRLVKYGDDSIAFADSQARVPRWNDAAGNDGPDALPVAFTEGRSARRSGHLWRVEIPLSPGRLQDVLAADRFLEHGFQDEVLRQDASRQWLDLELTKELHPGPYAMLPLGLPSGVRVYALTLEESPAAMVVLPEVAGNVFDASEVPAFKVLVENLTAAEQQLELLAVTTGYYGGRKQVRIPLRLAAGETASRRVMLPQTLKGKFDVTFVLTTGAGETLLERKTSFAVLPPDTREAEKDSPFGMWSWGGGHHSPSNRVEAELMRKAGVRYTLGAGYPSKQAYGVNVATDIVTGTHWKEVYRRDPEGAALEMVETMKQRTSDPLYWQVYWEDSLSRRHRMRFPPSLIGKPPPELNETEQMRLEAYWNRAEAYCRQVRKELPREKLALGAWANFVEEFLRRQFPREYLDALAFEIRGFLFQPERPPDIDSVHGLYFLRQWQEMYGYEDLPLIMVESHYHGTSPGYLAERIQSNYYVRDLLLSLAYGVKLFGMSAMIADVRGPYYHSAWGSAGLCHRAPETNPKEAYVAYSTMTRLLDGAGYLDYLETGSTSVYGLRFRARDGQNLYPFWTVRGQRDLRLQLSEETEVVILDGMHNPRRPRLEGRTLRLTVGEAPVYLKLDAEITAVELGPPSFREKPPRGAAPVDALDDLSSWRIRRGPDPYLETDNPRYPRRLGDFAYSMVEDEERGTVLQARPRPAPGHSLVPMYGVLERHSPRTIPGEPRKLGLWVKGNSGWGRVTFELVDAKGERWVGAGGEWRNQRFEDDRGDGFISFDGWRWVEVELCGHFAREYPRPGHHNWSSTGGDGFVDYPLSLTGLILELRDQVVYVNEPVPVKDDRVRLSNLMAVYR